jgi:hypothetical protein
MVHTSGSWLKYRRATISKALVVLPMAEITSTLLPGFNCRILIELRTASAELTEAPPNLKTFMMVDSLFLIDKNKKMKWSIYLK